MTTYPDALHYYDRARSSGMRKTNRTQLKFSQLNQLMYPKKTTTKTLSQSRSPIKPYIIEEVWIYCFYHEGYKAVLYHHQVSNILLRIKGQSGGLYVVRWK